MINNLLIAVHTFLMGVLTSLSVDEILVPKYLNWFINFSGLSFKWLFFFCFVLFCFLLFCFLSFFFFLFFFLKLMNSVLFVFTLKPMPATACSRLCSRDSVWAGVFTRSTSLHLKTHISTSKMQIKERVQEKKNRFYFLNDFTSHLKIYSSFLVFPVEQLLWIEQNGRM